MKPWSVLRSIGGVLLTGLGVIPQVVKHENCAWIGLEVCIGIGLGILAFELGSRSHAKA